MHCITVGGAREVDVSDIVADALQLLDEMGLGNTLLLTLVSTA